MLENIKNVLWILVQFVLGVTALLMFLLVLTMYIRSWPLLVSMAIVVYFLSSRVKTFVNVSLMTITACLYFDIMMVAGLFFQPVNCMMVIVLMTLAVLLMLRGKPVWLRLFVALLYIGYGVFYLFHNDIVGPIGFMIRDRPVDVPAQWYHCYRFFWLGIYSESVAFTVGIFAIVLIVIYNLFSKYKGKMCLLGNKWCC